MEEMTDAPKQKYYTQYQECLFEDPDEAGKWYEGFICGDRIIGGFQFFVVGHAGGAKSVFRYTHGIYDAEGVRLVEKY